MEKDASDPRSVRAGRRLCAAAVFCLFAALALTAQAQIRPTTLPPTPADLATNASYTNTFVVRILNLTPYTLTQYLPYITAKISQDTNRKVHKSMMFAPVGWPGTIPGLQGRWHYDGNWAFQMLVGNFSTHAYSFVVAWDDQGGFVRDSVMGWTVNSVYNSRARAIQADGSPYVGNVRLMLFFTRDKADVHYGWEVFKTVVAILNVFKGSIELIEGKAFGLFELLLGGADIAINGVDIHEKLDTGPDKWYVAAYTEPDSCDGDLCLPGIASSNSGGGEDAVIAQWPDNNGPFCSNLVVTTHLIRGLTTSEPGMGDTPKRLPIVNVTLWDAGLYNLYHDQAMAAASQNLSAVKLLAATAAPVNVHDPDEVRRQYLLRSLNYIHLIHSLTLAQKKTYDSTVQKMSANAALNDQEQLLLDRMIYALESGETMLQPEDPPHRIIRKEE